MPPRKKQKTETGNQVEETKPMSRAKMSVRKKQKTETVDQAEETKPVSQGVKKKEKGKKVGQGTYTRFLMKSEPESRFEKGVDVKFGIEDLKQEPDQTSCWDGVRNYQARNYMRDQMKKGQLAFFYHSNCKNPGIVGIVEIARESYVDYTQFDKADPHYDAAATKDKPKWFMVDVKFVRLTKRFISFQELKTLYEEHQSSDGPLKSLALIKMPRLSIQPLTEAEFEYIISIEDKPLEEEEAS